MRRTEFSRYGGLVGSFSLASANADEVSGRMVVRASVGASDQVIVVSGPASRDTVVATPAGEGRRDDSQQLIAVFEVCWQWDVVAPLTAQQGMRFIAGWAAEGSGVAQTNSASTRPQTATR